MWYKEDRLSEVLRTIKSFDWTHNMNCKYVSLRFDTRDGSFVLMDRAGEEITIEELQTNQTVSEQPSGVGALYRTFNR